MAKLQKSNKSSAQPCANNVAQFENQLRKLRSQRSKISWRIIKLKNNAAQFENQLRKLRSQRAKISWRIIKLKKRQQAVANNLSVKFL
jgi:chromosome segregation ATPase